MPDRAALVTRLMAGGFVAPQEEADELLAAAAGDDARCDALLARRLTGEPLAWVTGTTVFCGLTLAVHPGVYVPRFQSEPLAELAAERLPDGGVAVDVCTGCGAIAAVLADRRPQARVLATDASPAAVACARANGVDARAGDLLAPVADELRGGVDVVVAVVPYVPTGELRLLQRDTLAFEATTSYDGGPDGLALLRRTVAQAALVLRPGGTLLLELGGEQARALGDHLDAGGFGTVRVLRDEEGDVRGVTARRRP